MGTNKKILLIDDEPNFVDAFLRTLEAKAYQVFTGSGQQIEEVMKEFDEVLPVRFGIIASNADEIRSLLYRRYREFKTMLRDMDHMIELGVKGIWKNMDVIFKEISEENADIKKAKETIQNDLDQDTVEVKVAVGKMVKDFF